MTGILLMGMVVRLYVASNLVGNVNSVHLHYQTYALNTAAKITKMIQEFLKILFQPY